MISNSVLKRKAMDYVIKIISTISSFIGIFFLAWILIEVVKRGYSAFNWDFFTQLPAPPGVAGGGVANSIIGTLKITVLATVCGVPIGVLAGVYLAEFGSHSKLGTVIRFSINTMMGVPSIIIGLFAYTLLVLPFRQFSGYAGAFALAIIMMPIVARTSEDMLNLVPSSLRESALALGAPRWRVTIGIVFRAAERGLITGIILAVARVSGETAPLLFTSLNSDYWPSTLSQPTANLTVRIFNYAMSPYPDWQQVAWGASLLITVTVLLLTILARFLSKERK